MAEMASVSRAIALLAREVMQSDAKHRIGTV